MNKTINELLLGKPEVKTNNSITKMFDNLRKGGKFPQKNEIKIMQKSNKRNMELLK